MFCAFLFSLFISFLISFMLSCMRPILGSVFDLYVSNLYSPVPFISSVINGIIIIIIYTKYIIIIRPDFIPFILYIESDV